jgi:hypothetical protein
MGKRSLRKTLRDLNEQGALALFVGAGVSMDCGLPSWYELVRRVVKEVWRHDVKVAAELLTKPYEIAARFSKRQAGDKFNRIVHDCLYRDDITMSPTLQAIAESGIRNVCTFNFDDLLEEAFQAAGQEPDVASPNEAFTLSQNGVKLFHPHGFLSRFHDTKDTDAARIVFSEDDYHGLYSEPYSWSNIAQLMLLSGFSVLFIGLSMQDPNLRRLIYVSRSRGFQRQHFAIFRDPTVGAPPAEVDTQQRLRLMIEMDLKNLGVTPWFIASHDILPEVLRSISVPYLEGLQAWPKALA